VIPLQGALRSQPTVKRLNWQQQTPLQSSKPNKSLHPKAKAKGKAKAKATAKVKVKAQGTAKTKAKLGLRIAQKAGCLQRVRKQRRLRPLTTIMLPSNRFDWLMWSLRRHSQLCVTRTLGKDGNITILIQEPGCFLS
jgi:hypothetical protein